MQRYGAGTYLVTNDSNSTDYDLLVDNQPMNINNNTMVTFYAENNVLIPTASSSYVRVNRLSSKQNVITASAEFTT